jgi:hypothetical protein
MQAQFYRVVTNATDFMQREAVRVALTDARLSINLVPMQPTCQAPQS